LNEPYVTCAQCVVRDWCQRRNGTTPLPQDYTINPECGGYILLNQAIKLSQIPLEYQNANKRNFIIDTDNKMYKDYIIDTFNSIEEIVKNGNNLAFIHPQKGTGKSYTAIAFAMEYIFKSVMNPSLFNFESPLVLYIKYGSWANDLRQIYQLNDEDFTQKVLQQVKLMKTVPLLILDDIGNGRFTNYIKDFTYDVIDFRKENKKSTFFTSNLTLQLLEQENCLGDIITSRMLFNTVVYQLGGRDRRQEKSYILKPII